MSASLLRRLAAASLVFASVASAQAPASTIPSRLSNQEFWKFISDISEPGGSFRSDNFLSNETGFQTVIPELLEITKPGGVYLGVGPEQNFTYIAALKPKMAIIFDIRRGNVHMHLLYKALFELSADRAEFVSRLFSKPRPQGLDTAVTADSLFNAYWWVASDSMLYRRNRQQLFDQIKKRIPLSHDDSLGLIYVYDAFYYGGPRMDYNQGSGNGFNGARNSMPSYADLMVQNDGRGMQRAYLATEANFRFLKGMHDANLIVPVVGNFGGAKAIRAVGDYLRQRGATVTAFYASNVEQYLFQDYLWKQYYENVATLPLDASSTFIRSAPPNMVYRARSQPDSRLPSLIASMQELIAAFRAGRINGYEDVIAMSR
jgi:hypothetical protein